MGFNLRFGLIFLVSLLPALGNATGETIQIKDEHAPLLQEIDHGLSSLMDAAGITTVSLFRSQALRYRLKTFKNSAVLKVFIGLGPHAT